MKKNITTSLPYFDFSLKCKYNDFISQAITTTALHQTKPGSSPSISQFPLRSNLSLVLDHFLLTILGFGLAIIIPDWRGKIKM